MLIVVEGISASGKTTWCRKHAADFTVAETGPRDDAPDATLTPLPLRASGWNRVSAVGGPRVPSNDRRVSPFVIPTR